MCTRPSSQRVSHAKSILGVLAALLFILCGMVSCSTTRSLEDGQYRLAENKVKVTNGKKLKNREIEPYIKQKANSYLIFGWNPFLNVYNWSGKNGEKGIGKIFRKIGVAPVVYDASLVHDSEENILRHLEYLGYYGSSVKSSATMNGRKVDVTYDVTLGKQYRISDIIYETPEGEFREDFMADTSRISVHRGDFLSEKSLEAESERSASYFRRNGWFGFSKNYYFFEADTLSRDGNAVLRMMVREYTRNQNSDNAKPFTKYRFGTVRINHDKDLAIKSDILRDMVTIVPGREYDERDVNNTYSRLSALKMFSAVNVELTNEDDSSRIACDISLSKAKMQGFKLDLEASTNSSGLIGISPQLSYFHKNIFKGGQWLNLGFLGNFQFKYNDRSIKSNEFGVSSSLSFPRLVGIPNSVFKGGNIPRTEINLTYSFQDRPEYTRNMISANYGYTGTLNKGHFRYQINPIRTKIVRMSNMDDEFLKNLASNPFILEAYQSHFDHGAGFGVYYSSSNDLTPNISHEYVKFQFDASGNTLSAFNRYMKTDERGVHTIWDTQYSQYVRGELTLGKTFVFGNSHRHAFATRLLVGAGYAYGNSSTMPFEKQFYSGGANSMRGWQVRALGPGRSKMDPLFIIPSQTGDMKLEANLEYRFPMFWKLCGAMFTDVGNIWTLREASTDEENLTKFKFNNLGKSIAANWGFGLRVDLTFLILRIDAGVKLYDPSLDSNNWIGPDRWTNKDSFAIHFGVGYPF